MAEEVVVGKHVTIHFDANRCVHSRNCVLSHPDVFVPNVQGEWIHPDAQPVQELIRIGQNCPSGAIRVTVNAGSGGIGDFKSSEGLPVVNTLRVRENGPLAFEAEIQIKATPEKSPRATLCRCGHSSRKPYCDGSHVAAGFVASGEPATAQFEDLPARNGAVNVTPLPNGPLRVVGNLEVVSGTGRTCNKVKETYLCRCGQSKNKPYCDGNHKSAGFQAE
ncbi:MAG: CDGSH iron-sulfur domain-containing protein [Gammaproteobacteria bacterium]|nr:CDGSH iron-sulfur domain-containing protein [Gammaproteobacteria bacterium]